MPAFLGLDVGTQGTKGVVVDAERGVIARAHRGYDLLPTTQPGAAEQHPQTWLDAIEDVARELCAAPVVDCDAIQGVGVSGQQHGCVVVDDRGEVIRPAKLWCDTSTAAEARELSGAFGRSVPVGFTASKILWLRRHEPEHWARTARVLLPHDYVDFVLTGETWCEAGDASGTGVFDPVSRAFDRDAVRTVAAELEERLPPLREAGELGGTLNARGAALLGLREGIPVSVGGGDNMMSAIGSGATRPGVVVVSLGTSGTVFTHCAAPVVDPDGAIAGFCDSTGGWLPLLCVMNATGVTEEVRAAFGLGHDELTALATGVPLGCDGLMWLPFLQGERVPDLPEASGTLLGLRAGHLRPGVLYRAAIEGVALNLASGVDRMRALGVSVDAVRAVGGAARNPLWRSILADVFGCPLTELEEPESAALGAALQAMWTWRRARGDDVGADDVARPFVRERGEPTEPDADRAARYRELGARFGGEVARVYGP